jgi:hypothetical protein
LTGSNWKTLINGERLQVLNRRLLLKLSIAIASCVLITCVTNQPSQQPELALGDLFIDPLQCVGLTLRSNIHVRAEIIHEPSIMFGRYLIVLRYREGGDESAYSPELKLGYNNVSLVSEVAANDEKPLIVYRRYCVVEMWRFYQEERRKTCSIWTIEEDSASMKVMLEGIDGEVFDERIVPLSKEDVETLTHFYQELTRKMIGKLEGPVPAA